MAKTIYVGNLSYDSTEEGLRSLFERYGTVHSAKIITDRFTGKSRGFGFVEMDADTGDQAVMALNGAELDGRSLRVNEARPREPRAPRRY
jgi:RNA recognition motif-containing protein